MRVLNVHQRVLAAPTPIVGKLIDSLASPQDALWPCAQWPPMQFDRPLQVGAIGGHGPIRYFVEAYELGRNIQFKFTAPAGFLGYHRYDIEERGPDQTCLWHVLSMQTEGPALITWPLIFKWLHDALIEDSLDRAERSLGGQPPIRHWSVWVQMLRWITGNVLRSRTRQQRPT